MSLERRKIITVGLTVHGVIALGRGEEDDGLIMAKEEDSGGCVRYVVVVALGLALLLFFVRARRMVCLA